MVKNKITYLKHDEYNELLNEIEERYACSNRIKNICINEQYSNVNLSRYIFGELKINRNVSEDMENKLDVLYDYLSDIPSLLETKIVGVNIFIENMAFINNEMLDILKRLQKFFDEEIIECGSEDDFPMCFDIYISVKSSCIEKADSAPTI